MFTSGYYALGNYVLFMRSHGDYAFITNTKCCSLPYITHITYISYITCIIKTHSHLSAAKKGVQHTSLLFTGTAKSPFPTPHISITTEQISTKFTYFMLSINTILHTKFEENPLRSSQDMCF